jgi:hypothetical protein
MKTRIRLQMQQNDLRARTIAMKRARSKTGLPLELFKFKKRVAATVLSDQGFTPEQLSQVFGWKVEDVRNWLESGRKLL